jgi:predicted O-methyltransferase YrrM
MTMTGVIDEIFNSQIVKDRSGNQFALRANVDRSEGRSLFELIASDAAVEKTLEIGCAYGVSSLHICSALSGKVAPKHVIIDPFQHSEFRGIGVLNLERAGFDFFELIESPSEFALPEIAQREAGTFDLVFIDGWHTFDHTLLDLFYANLLVRVGGYVVVDDCNMASVGKAISYLAQYPSYKVWGLRQSAATWKQVVKRAVKTVVPPAIARNIVPHMWYDKYYVRTLFPSMAVLRKISEDKRSWNWFEAF